MSDCALPTRPGDPLEERLLHALPRLRAYLASRRPPIRRADVEDVVQEVVTRALRYRESYDADRAVWPWLRRMSERVLSDHLRSSACQPSLSEELDPPAPEERPAIDAHDEIARLLASLPRRERDVLVRFHRNGQSVREIATDLGLPEGTVKSHLSRARRRLAEDPGSMQ